MLAPIAIPAVATRARSARLLVWLFNIEGTVDLIIAIVLATAYEAAPLMGPAYWIPAFWVPALLVTHYITFIVLLRGRWPERDPHMTNAADGRIPPSVAHVSAKADESIGCGQNVDPNQEQLAADAPRGPLKSNPHVTLPGCRRTKTSQQNECRSSP